MLFLTTGMIFVTTGMIYVTTGMISKYFYTFFLFPTLIIIFVYWLPSL